MKGTDERGLRVDRKGQRSGPDHYYRDRNKRGDGAGGIALQKAQQQRDHGVSPLTKINVVPVTIGALAPAKLTFTSLTYREPALGRAGRHAGGQVLVRTARIGASPATRPRILHTPASKH